MRIPQFYRRLHWVTWACIFLTLAVLLMANLGNRQDVARGWPASWFQHTEPAGGDWRFARGWPVSWFGYVGDDPYNPRISKHVYVWVGCLVVDIAVAVALWVAVGVCCELVLRWRRRRRFAGKGEIPLYWNYPQLCDVTWVFVLSTLGLFLIANLWSYKGFIAGPEETDRGLPAEWFRGFVDRYTGDHSHIILWDALVFDLIVASIVSVIVGVCCESIVRWLRKRYDVPI